MAIKRRFSTNGCAIVNISDQLSEVFTKLSSGEYDFDQAQEIINSLHQDAVNRGIENKFADYLAKNNLTQYNFTYSNSENAPQLLIKRLDASDPKLFRYHDTTKNKIDAMFAHDVFSNLFLNRSKNFKGNPYITSASDFNNGVIRFKQNLCENIIRELGLRDFENINFFDSQGAVASEKGYNYSLLMNDPIVGKWLDNNMQKVINDPITYEKDLRILYSLYALNNFDFAIEQELSGLITLNPGTKGALHNTQYASQVEGKTTEYWADDSHEAKDVRNYTSNLAKFIVKQIPKVIKVGNTYKQLPGQYLGANDLYVLGDILRKAKFEALLKKQINDRDTVKNFKNLFNLRSSLPAFQQGKKVLLDSIENFLYNENDPENHSISYLFQTYLPRNLKILDIEGLMAYEASQSYAPTFLDFDQNFNDSDVNYGGRFQTGSLLHQNLTDFIFQQIQSKSKRALISKEASKAGFNIDRYDNLLNNRILRLGEQYDTFKLQHKKELTALIKQMSLLMHDSAKYKALINAAKKADTPAMMRENCYTLASSIISQAGITNSFKTDYNNSVSEIPQVQFTSNSGNTMPVYRIQSAISQLDWFIHQYASTQNNTGQNFLVDHPQLLTKYNDVKAQNGISIEASKNTYFKEYVSFMLGAGNESDYTDYRKFSVSDQLGTYFLKNLLDMPKGLFYTQLAAYSDKSSIIWLCTNLQSKLFGTSSDPYNNMSLASIISSPEKGISTLRQIDYKYRKNAMVSKINSILTKWNTVKAYFPGLENLDIAPLTNLNFSESTKISDFNILQKKLQNLQNWLAYLNNGKTKEENANTFRKLVEIANREGFDFIDELDYVKNKDNSLKLNAALLSDFANLKSLKEFNTSQDAAVQALFDSEEYKECEKSIIVAGNNASQDSSLYKLLFEQFGKTGDSLAKKLYNKQLRKSVTTLNTELFRSQVRIQIAVSNLIRNAALELISKQYYLDPAKNPSNEISSRIDSMSKRMVLFPATIQPFMQGRFDGVSEQMKFSVITDPTEKVWNPNGGEANQKIFDGCGFTSPFYSRMETNSLPGQGVRGTKKTLGTSVVGQNSTLFKWAETPITNEKMRNSLGGKYNLLTLFKKMHSEPIGSNIDLTEDFFGNLLIRPGQLINKNLYVKQGLDFAKIVKFARNEDGTYSVTYQPSTKSGKDVGESFEQSYNINSIYDLWNALGGIDSYELIGDNLEPSEASLDATFEYIIRVGQLTDNIENIRHISQDTVVQPLRDKFISIAVFQGAIKRGSANINFVEDAFNSQSKLASAKFNTVSFGKQLDANHHSDQADIREMTQTISTLAANGYTFDLAQQAYNEIGTLVEDSIQKLSKYLNDYETQGLLNSIESISKSLVTSLSKTQDTGSTKAYIDLFMNDLETKMLPISDRRFYRPFIKMILESLNKSAIRRRYSGLGGVLNPTSNILQIYTLIDSKGNEKVYTYSALTKQAEQWARQLRIIPGDGNKLLFQDYFYSLNDNRKFEKFLVEEFLKANFNGKIIADQKGVSHVCQDITDLNDIKVLDTIMLNGKLITLDSAEKYLDLKRSENITSIYKVLDVPHDLRPQIIQWSSIEADQNNEMQQNKQEDIYSTIEAELQYEIGKQKYSNEEIDEILSNLSDEGNDIKNTCKL